MGSYHVVRAGDCINSIAEQSGHFWETIWHADENQELRGLRSDPNSLHVGDKVFVPDLRHESVSLATGKRHRIKRVGVPNKLVLRLLWPDGRPRADARYCVDIEGNRTEGVTNAEGYLEVSISGQAQRGTLTVHAMDEDDEDEHYPLLLGRLPPHDLLLGAQVRLRNLGFLDVEPTDTLDDPTRAALELVQSNEGLPASGEFDGQTALAIRRLHGS
jgi:hypothetical protein